MKRPNLVKHLIAAALLCAATSARSPSVNVSAQSPPAQLLAVTHFDKDGLSFDYPSNWTRTDRSTPQVQHLSLTHPGSSALIMVVAYREPLQSGEQVMSVRASMTKTFVEAVAQKLGMKEAPPPEASECATVDSHVATGIHMAGQVGGQPSAGEVYSLVLGQRFVNLIYVRQDSDDAKGSLAWKTVLDTLKIEPPLNQMPEATNLEDIVSGGVLNGRVISKPQPVYPLTAKQAHVQGTVIVQIVVDEQGNVLSAHAIQGPPLLRKAGEEAASKARFTPTLLCGRPVKVTGVITYHWVLR
ncbi:MAG: energy transducer TonB [Acidobacteriota bacterium]|nr:energy transducer TonB [Acidobacteriota bacterium]MDQ5836877.1 energy transducer TonB [Acidobacteriota bacterium]